MNNQTVAPPPAFAEATSAGAIDAGRSSVTAATMVQGRVNDMGATPIHNVTAVVNDQALSSNSYLSDRRFSAGTMDSRSKASQVLSLLSNVAGTLDAQLESDISLSEKEAFQSDSDREEYRQAVAVLQMQLVSDHALFVFPTACFLKRPFAHLYTQQTTTQRCKLVEDERDSITTWLQSHSSNESEDVDAEATLLHGTSENQQKAMRLQAEDAALDELLDHVGECTKP